MGTNPARASNAGRASIVGPLMRIFCCWMLLWGCGSQVTRDHSDIRAKRQAIEAQLPAAKGDVLWGDGFGPTQREAVLDARRAVAEQIVSQVQSKSRSRVAEAGGDTDREAAVEVRSKSHFAHAELIETLAVSKRPGGFVARAVLDKSKAAKVYAAELKRARERLGALGPVVTKGIAALDTSVLLASDSAPGQLMEQQAGKARVLAVLGRPSAVKPPAESLALERRASVARRAARIRLALSGKVSKPIRQAVYKEVGALLAGRGCRFAEAPHDVPPAGVPAANASLNLQVRNHQEEGLKWRYLSVELSILDARTGRPVFRFDAPELVHAGGPTWARADAALVRRLSEALAARTKVFEALICR